MRSWTTVFTLCFQISDLVLWTTDFRPQAPDLTAWTADTRVHTTGNRLQILGYRSHARSWNSDDKTSECNLQLSELRFHDTGSQTSEFGRQDAERKPQIADLRLCPQRWDSRVQTLDLSTGAADLGSMIPGRRARIPDFWQQVLGLQVTDVSRQDALRFQTSIFRSGASQHRDRIAGCRP